jgi:hypothetical protein
MGKAYRLAVEHGVERGHLVHAHVRHAKNLRDLSDKIK